MAESTTNEASGGGFDRQTWAEHPVFGIDAPADEKQFVYHYTSLASASAIALTSTLSLSPMWTMNDPAESWFPETIPVTTGTHGTQRVSDERRESLRKELKRLRDQVRLVCFARDAIDGKAVGSAARASGRGFAQTSMWAHYGDLHRGVVLVLDRYKLEAAVKETFGANGLSGDVVYSAGFSSEWDSMQTVAFDTEPNAQRIFHDRVEPTLLTKAAHWQEENEYRVLVLDWQQTDCLLPLEGSVEGVVLGHGVEEFRFATARRVAETLCGARNAAIVEMNNLVLEANPIVDGRGTPQWWSHTARHLGSMLS